MRKRMLLLVNPTPTENFEFLKTGVNRVLRGAVMGASALGGLQALRLHGQGASSRQKHLVKEIKKHQIELEDNPTVRNRFKMRTLRAQLTVATTMKKHPGKALLGSGLLGAAIGGLAGRKV